MTRRTVGRLLATDLDGTLLRSDGTVSERSRRALRDARAAGWRVVLATGRPIRFVGELCTDLGVDAPVVCANGAVIYDAGGDEVVVEQGLPLETYEEVLRTLRDELDGLTFAVETARAFSCEPLYAELAQWPIPPGAVAADGRLLCDGPPSKVLVRHPSLPVADTLERIQGAVGHVASVTHSTAHVLEIAALGVDKGVGLARLAADLGMEASEAIAFGDMPNDVAMLQWAGRGVAVANAHETVIRAADEVTASNDEDGVARVVESL